LSNTGIIERATSTRPGIPLPYGTEFEGERLRDNYWYLDCGGGLTPMVAWVTTQSLNEVQDGRIEVIGPDINDVPPGSRLPLAISVEVSGLEIADYGPILERQIPRFISYARGCVFRGQRDIAQLTISREAVSHGFRLRHLGILLHAALHREYGGLFDKLQVSITTAENRVREIVAEARATYARRDARIEGMADEEVDTFYSCTYCQSHDPGHVCIVTPERSSLCGSYNWLDCRAIHRLNQAITNQPVPKGEVLDPERGEFRGVNEFVRRASGGGISRYTLYSLMRYPLTISACPECLAAVLPLCNGVMSVPRDYDGMTPLGLRFAALADTLGVGRSTPGFIGHSKYNIGQRKFLSGDGGILRLVWMPRSLKDTVKERLQARGMALGIPNLPDIIADETVGTTEEAILPFLKDRHHPALTMDAILE
jgi:acetyl-CoA synthase